MSLESIFESVECRRRAMWIAFRLRRPSVLSMLRRISTAAIQQFALSVRTGRAWRCLGRRGRRSVGVRTRRLARHLRPAERISQLPLAAAFRNAASRTGELYSSARCIRRALRGRTEVPRHHSMYLVAITDASPRVLSERHRGSDCPSRNPDTQARYARVSYEGYGRVRCPSRRRRLESGRGSLGLLHLSGVIVAIAAPFPDRHPNAL